MVRLHLAIVLASLGGCLQERSIACGDLVCRSDQTCFEGRCAYDDQIEACLGLNEGASCSSTGTPQGQCRDGLCTAPACGDGIRSVTEECDGLDLGGATCATFGFHAEAGLACGSDCHYDLAQCSMACG